MNRSWKILTTAALALLLLFPSFRVYAGLVAANTEIFAEVTLTYNDGSGALKTAKASVTIIVTLVPSSPSLSAPPDLLIIYSQTDTPASYTYTLTAGGNGPDDYTLDLAVIEATNASDYSVALSDQTTPYTFQLGATVTTTGSSTRNILISSDGANDGEVNGIAPGDTVVIDGKSRIVQSVEDPESGTATIALAEPLSDAPGAGVSVWEQQGFEIQMLSGTIETIGESIALTVETTVANSFGEIADQVVTTFSSGKAELTKFARNLTTPAANSGGIGGRDFSLGSSVIPYFTGGVRAAKNDVIEYILLVENVGTAPVTDCDIQDLLPIDLVELQSGIYGGGDFLYFDESGAQTTLTSAEDSDTATLSGSNMAFNLGTGATSAAPGSIDAGKEVIVVYQVKVK